MYFWASTVSLVPQLYTTRISSTCLIPGMHHTSCNCSFSHVSVSTPAPLHTGTKGSQTHCTAHAMSNSFTISSSHLGSNLIADIQSICAFWLDDREKSYHIAVSWVSRLEIWNKQTEENINGQNFLRSKHWVFKTVSKPQKSFGEQSQMASTV
jgi:hypothetical protein